MHDGAPFNKDDVEAITSAAESTKRGDSKKQVIKESVLNLCLQIVLRYG